MDKFADVMQESPAGGLRANKGKLRFDLIPPEMDKAVAEVLTQGATKYGDRNWEKGINIMTCIASLRRHLNAYEAGHDIDSESGLHHFKHILTNAAFIVTYIERGRSDLDDRPNSNSQKWPYRLLTKECPPDERK